ncbi:MAG TPA: hypothetical protein DCS82_06180 [Rhodospirillaceae bacterium]|nr:hypothetical protein [Rhodospirillaceae bacterium]HAT35284.1 hypothetical protein [Rhodospirillaceae bacterium]|tara:strand:- start:596 stop:1063 length:468 start_codon:yes stop_codon:yes gene_type:complete
MSNIKLWVSSELDCSAKQAFDDESRIANLTATSKPFLTYAPVSPNPPPINWQARELVVLRPRLFGMFALPPHGVMVEEFDPARYLIVTNEYGGVIRHWIHRMQIEPLAPKRCRQIDEIEAEIETGGWLIWKLSQTLYRYRHWRRRRLANFAVEKT